MPRLYLGLVLHNHQPVGNYDHVIAQVYEQAYGPMLSALERHPGVKVALHNSGCLFDWIAVHRTDYLERLATLCKRGQVEMVTGGYYEPVLPMIPDGDKQGQIAKLSRYIDARFGQQPKGLWLTERVWEPGLPSPLVDAGVEWTLVDDAHFRMAGMRDDQLDGYFVTEDQGKRVNLFAGSQRLRYTIPWLDVPDLMSELRGVADAAASEAPLLVLGDDGEKFGAWPTTYAHVWEKGWIERFFTALEAAADWLQAITPGAYAQRFEARGLTYLPAASYAEMMEWALPAESAAEYHHLSEQVDREGRADLQRYLRGGFWRYFLAKYPEANAMHKRALRIDGKLATAESPEARDALWQAQCNCPYWHGVFGGLYLRHIRAATNANLVRAERLADDAAAGAGAGVSGVTVRVGDWDFDGHEELLMQSPEISLLVHPKLGGMLSEFDLRRRDHALLDVLTRRREAYHIALADGVGDQPQAEATNIHGSVRVKEEGLADALVFDRFRRGGMQEWIVPAGTTVYGFLAGNVEPSFEPGGAWTCSQQSDAERATVTMTRDAGGWRVTKEVALAPAGERLRVRYTIANVSGERRDARFVSEWNLAPPRAAGFDDSVARLRMHGLPNDATWDVAAQPGAVHGGEMLELFGGAPWWLRCETSAPREVWHYPVESVSSSEGGVERVPQGVSISVVALLELDAGASTSLAVEWSVVEPVE